MKGNRVPTEIYKLQFCIIKLLPLSAKAPGLPIYEGWLDSIKSDAFQVKAKGI